MYRLILATLVLTHLVACTVIQSDRWPVGENAILLTIDDGPNGKISESVLAVLEKHNVKATFCYVGRNVEKYPDLVMQAVNAGHQIAIHSYSRRFPPFYDDATLIEDIEKTRKAIHNAIQMPPDIFLYRPPSGIVTPSVRRVIKQQNLQLAYISFYIHDAPMESDSADVFLEKLKRAVAKRKGAAIVIHESRFLEKLSRDNTVDKTWLPDVLDRFIIWAKNNDYQFVSYPKDTGQ